MPTFQAKKIPQKEQNINDILAKFCFYFPQYKFHEAKKLPYKRIIQMLNVVMKEEARKLYQFAQIASAPHTKKGKGVKKLLDHYKKIIEK